MQISSYAHDMLNSTDFTTNQHPEDLALVKLQVSDLGFTTNPTTDQLYARALELGLELCPAETGPHLRLQDTTQSPGWCRIAMKPIADHSSRPHVFRLGRGGGGLHLGNDWAGPPGQWGLDVQFVFRLRKVPAEA
jgi:hypothetical protein